MKIAVIGPGRWGAFIAWYLNRTGHEVSLHGRAGSVNMTRFIQTRTSGAILMPREVKLSTDIGEALSARCIVVSINSQSLRELLSGPEFSSFGDRTLVLCMKGIEIGTGKRLSEVAAECCPQAKIAVWLGPGHAEQFVRGNPNCMVIDSLCDDTKYSLVNEFSSELIRFYYGDDIIGNEIGAATKNVIGIAAGMLDGSDRSSLKGALMARGTREISRLIGALGGRELSAYGLCCLGDFEATVFSPYSHNRRYGEAFIRGEEYIELAEGFYTVDAVMRLCKKHNIEMPISEAVHDILYHGKDAGKAFEELFAREKKVEF